MFYVIRVKGWPVLVWLENAPPPERYEVLATCDDVLMAVASFYDAVEQARVRLAPRGPGAARGDEAAAWYAWPPSGDYGRPSGKTMSPSPPAAKNKSTYDSSM